MAEGHAAVLRKGIVVVWDFIRFPGGVLRQNLNTQTDSGAAERMTQGNGGPCHDRKRGTTPFVQHYKMGNPASFPVNWSAYIDLFPQHLLVKLRV